MSIYDEVLAANGDYAASFGGKGELASVRGLPLRCSSSQRSSNPSERAEPASSVTARRTRRRPATPRP
jgi:hypothetical protein